MDFITNVLFATEECKPVLSLFSWYHILLFLIVIGIFHYMNHKQIVNDKTERMARVSTILMTILQIVCYIWYLCSDLSFFKLALPLYTCRIALYLFIAGIFFNKEKSLKLASYYGVYGGISGVVFPTIFKYPFPHILQITTIVLHIYIFLLGAYYLFVKKIGMNLSETKWCCKITIGFILFNAVFNTIFDTNYISTRRIPMSLINTFGINLPDFLCLPAVIIGYVAVTYFQYWALNKTIEYMEEKKNKIKENNL